MSCQSAFGSPVFLPLMPKGVEHLAPLSCVESTAEVFLPLMPKGVEHEGQGRVQSITSAVFLPLMPKGVEHTPARGLGD